jgi:hypothetical protein
MATAPLVEARDLARGDVSAPAHTPLFILTHAILI